MKTKEDYINNVSDFNESVRVTKLAELLVERDKEIGRKKNIISDLRRTNDGLELRVADRDREIDKLQSLNLWLNAELMELELREK